MSEPAWVGLGGGEIDYVGDWSGAAAYRPGQVVRYNAVDYLAVNPSVGQTPPTVFGPIGVAYGTSLPASPIDGQEYTLVDSLTNPTYQWRFRFNAGSSSAYKWECVGGGPASVAVDVGTGQVATAGTSDFASAGGPSFTLPRTGDYLISVAAEVVITSGTGGNAMMSYRLGAAAANYKDGIYLAGSLGSSHYNRWGSNQRRHNGISGVVEAVYSSNGVTIAAQFNFRVLTVQPVRVA